MDKIWANRLIVGDQSWENVPKKKRQSVLEELTARVIAGEITEAKMNEIINTPV